MRKDHFVWIVMALVAWPAVKIAEVRERRKYYPPAKLLSAENVIPFPKGRIQRR